MRSLFGQFISTCAVMALFALGAGQARADYFTWTYESADSSISVNGDLTASSIGVGVYHATSGTILDGTNGVGFTLSSGGPSVFTSPLGSFNVDNVIYDPQESGSNVDYWGLLFAAPGGTPEINIFGNGVAGADNFWQGYAGPTWDISNGAGVFTITSHSSDVIVVPEPSSLALLGLGGIGLSIGAYRRCRVTV